MDAKCNECGMGNYDGRTSYGLGVGIYLKPDGIGPTSEKPTSGLDEKKIEPEAYNA